MWKNLTFPTLIKRNVDYTKHYLGSVGIWMVTELLVIKYNDRYIRVKDGEYTICGLDKASVFPMEKMEEVKEHIKTIREKQNLFPRLFKLILREELIV